MFLGSQQSLFPALQAKSEKICGVIRESRARCLQPFLLISQLCGQKYDWIVKVMTLCV